MSDALKDMISKDTFEVPELISCRIDQTLENLPVHRKGTGLISVAAVVIAVLVFTAGIGVAFPSFAENIPVLNSVFKYFYERSNLSEEYLKYSTGVNQSVTDKGLTLTINEVVCDNSSLNIGYTVKGESKLEGDYYPRALLRVNGKMLNSGGGGTGEFLDENTFAGILEYDTARQSLPDEFRLDYKVDSLGDKEGSWNFKFRVSKAETEKKTVTFAVNLRKALDDVTINIEKVSFTPLNSTIVLNGSFNNEKQDGPQHGMFKYENWFLFDDKGRQIQGKGAGSGGTNKSFTSEMHFSKAEEIPKSLTVIPYRYLESRSAEKILGGTVDNLPAVISQGKIGTVAIESIEYLGDKASVHLIAEGTAPLQQVRGVFLSDEAGNEIWSDERHGILERGSKPNEFIMSYPALEKGKKYKIGTVNFDTYLEIREDLKFTIPLNN